MAGIKGYVTNITNPDAEFVIGAYHQLWHIEKSFRMSKHDLPARPIYRHKRESIEAHLTIVFAALAIARHIEHPTCWTIRKFVRTARATAPSTSAPANTSLPPKTHSPSTCATPSP